MEVGFGQVVVLIAQVGLAGEGGAGELAVLPIEQEVQVGLVGQAAVELHAAVHAALRQIGQHGGGVEAGAVNAGGDFAALEELEQGFAVHFAAVCGGDFHLLQADAALAVGFVGEQPEGAAGGGLPGFKLPIGLRAGKAT